MTMINAAESFRRFYFLLLCPVIIMRPRLFYFYIASINYNRESIQMDLSSTLFSNWKKHKVPYFLARCRRVSVQTKKIGCCSLDVNVKNGCNLGVEIANIGEDVFSYYFWWLWDDPNRNQYPSANNMRFCFLNLVLSINFVGSKP